MLLLEPETYELLKRAQMNMNGTDQPGSDVIVNQQNESLVKDKILKRNDDVKKWNDYGKNLKPIISEGIKDATSNGDAEDDILRAIKDKVPSNYVTKVTRLYSLLREVEGISISAKEITVDGTTLFGDTATLLAELCKPKKYVSFNCDALLSKIKDIEPITELIANKQALSILNGYNNFATSTPTKSYSEASPSRGSERFFSGLEGSFLDADSTIKSAKKKRKGKGLVSEKKRKKPTWKTLFS